ncbi:MAG: HAD family phosphatase [Nitrospirota bacterium]
MRSERPDGGDIKAVFFDLGKVMLTFSHENIVERLLSRTPQGKVRPPELFEYLFNAGNGLCNLYDEGKISSRDFYGSINKNFSLNIAYEEFIPLWNDIFTENAEVSGIISEVRKKRPVYLLSNVNELHWEFAKRRFPVLTAMDGWVLSYLVGAKKPSRKIYEAALETAGAGPWETVFIDDLEENTAGAEESGIRGITFRGSRELLLELRKMRLMG